MPAIYPDVNGVRVSYGSIELLGLGGPLRLKGIKSINYRDVGEIGEVMGTSARPLGRTRGTVRSEGDIEIYREEWDDLLPLLTGAGLVGYMETAWPVTVTWAEPSQLQKTKRDILIGVRLFGADSANAEGGVDASTIKLGMSIIDILWNGLYGALRTSPF